MKNEPVNKQLDQKIDELFLTAACQIFNDGSHEIINADSPEVKEWAKLRTIKCKQSILALIASEYQRGKTDGIVEYAKAHKERFRTMKQTDNKPF